MPTLFSYPLATSVDNSAYIPVRIGSGSGSNKSATPLQIAQAAGSATTGYVDGKFQTNMVASAVNAPVVNAVIAYVTQRISDLIAGAPGALDTLNEIDAALGGDPNFSNTIINLLAAKVAMAQTLTIFGQQQDLTTSRTFDPVTRSVSGAASIAKTDNGGYIIAAASSNITVPSATGGLGLGSGLTIELPASGTVTLTPGTGTPNVTFNGSTSALTKTGPGFVNLTQQSANVYKVTDNQNVAIAMRRSSALLTQQFDNTANGGVIVPVGGSGPSGLTKSRIVVFQTTAIATMTIDLRSLTWNDDDPISILFVNLAGSGAVITGNISFLVTGGLYGASVLQTGAINHGSRINLELNGSASVGDWECASRFAA